MYTLNLQSSDTNLEFEVDQISQSEPNVLQVIVIVMENPGEETAQYFVCVQNSLHTELKSLHDATLDMICAY